MVSVAVVATRELHDGVAPGGATSETDRGHHGFGAGGNESHHLQMRNRRHDQLGQLDLLATGGAEAEPAGGSRRHCLDYIRVSVAENQGAPRTHVIDIAVSVDVEDVEEDRVAPDRAKGAHRGVDPCRHQFAGTLVELPAARAVAHNQPSASAWRPW